MEISQVGSQPRGRDCGSEKPRVVRVYGLGLREERGLREEWA